MGVVVEGGGAINWIEAATSGRVYNQFNLTHLDLAWTVLDDAVLTPDFDVLIGETTGAVSGEDQPRTIL